MNLKLFKPVTLSKLINWGLVALILFLLVSRLPVWINQYQQQGALAPKLSLNHLVTQQEIKLPDGQAFALIFWTTTCPYCQVEMARIQKLVEQNKVPNDRVFAVNTGESSQSILNYFNKAGYTYAPLQDPGNLAAKTLGAQGVPTILLVNKNNEITWMTLGVSPSLELRLTNHFKNFYHQKGD